MISPQAHRICEALISQSRTSAPQSVPNLRIRDRLGQEWIVAWYAVRMGDHSRIRLRVINDRGSRITWLNDWPDEAIIAVGSAAGF